MLLSVVTFCVALFVPSFGRQGRNCQNDANIQEIRETVLDFYWTNQDYKAGVIPFSQVSDMYYNVFHCDSNPRQCVGAPSCHANELFGCQTFIDTWEERYVDFKFFMLGAVLNFLFIFIYLFFFFVWVCFVFTQLRIYGHISCENGECKKSNTKHKKGTKIFSPN